MNSVKTVTILNEKANDEAVFMDYEDDFRKLDEATISAYDSKGKLINTYKKKEMEKLKHNDGFSLVTDDKLYYFNVPIYKYPITIITRKKIVQSAFIDVMDIMLDEPNQAVINMQFKYTLPIENKLRYNFNKIIVNPIITNNINEVEYLFSIKNIKPFKKIDGTTKQDYAQINIAPTYFEMDNYKGDYTNWQTFGNWYYTLSEKQNDLNENAIKEIKNVVVNAKNNFEKIDLLYKYLQQNYRYVSIQLGIGGFKPFSASFVHKNKYGDCKALSNYMQAMLHTVGIESNQVLIGAGNGALPVNASFVNNSFNHVILCVPNNNDTIWLECTSNNNKTNVLGAFTENRLALAITPNGGKLVKTPTSDAIQNIMNTSTTVTINDDWSALVLAKYKLQGEFDAHFDENFTKSTTGEQRKYLLNYINQKPFDEFTVVSNENNITSINLGYYKIYDFKTGSKFFVKSQLQSLSARLLKMEESDSSSFNFKFPFVKSDTIAYHLPKGTIVDNNLKNTTIILPNGIFKNKIEYKKDINKVIIITDLTITNTKITNEQMALFKNTVTQIQQVLQESLVIVQQ